MSGKRKNSLPGIVRTKQPAQQSDPASVQPRLQIAHGQVVHMEHLPPELLARFNEVLPGSARELLDNSLAESAHRRSQQDRTLEANIALQQQMLARQEVETRNSFRSDALGQCLGFALGLCCAGIAATLAWFKPEAWMVAVAIAAMPALTIGVKVVIDSKHLHKLKNGDSQN